MDFSIRPEIRTLLDRVAAMVRDEIAPLEAEYHAEIAKGDRWAYTARQAEILEGLSGRTSLDLAWRDLFALLGVSLRKEEMPIGHGHPLPRVLTARKVRLGV